VVNPFTLEIITMKKLSILIAILGIAFWVLPAGAEKVRLTDAQMDGITAGTTCGQICVPPPSSVNGIVNAFVNASGSPSPPMGRFELGGGTPKGRGNSVMIIGQGSIMSPPTGSFRICGRAFGVPFSLWGGCD
jgi:hypothetical protein